MPTRRASAVLRHKRRMLPRAVPSWMERAACASHDDPDLWFPERGEDERQQEALRICAACPVGAACLAYVLSMPPQPGIWGGTTEEQRTPMTPPPQVTDLTERRRARLAEQPRRPQVRQRRGEQARERRPRFIETATGGDLAAAIAAVEQEQARTPAPQVSAGGREHLRRGGRPYTAGEAGQ